MAMIRLDQVTAWMIAVLGAGAVFGAGYGLYKVGVSAANQAVEERTAAAAALREQRQAEARAAASATDIALKPAPHRAAVKIDAPAPGRAVGRGSWSYAGSTGPERWATLDPSWRLCGNGRSQSPVDISATYTDRKALPIKFEYGMSRVSLRNTGNTLQADFTSLSNYIQFEGERFDLTHIQFHAPAEHRLQDATLPFEMQLFHQTETGKTAVVAILFQTGETNKVLAEMLRSLPEVAGEEAPDSLNFNPMAIIPKKRAYYNYQGSLTTPPCSEGVTWIVMQQMLEVSVAQSNHFMRVFGKNARPVQSMGSRRVRLAPR